MSTISPASFDSQTDFKSATRTVAAALNRWFYPATGVLMLALVVAGFRLFYFNGQSYPGRPITPPIRSLVFAHAGAMSLWIVLFAVQPLLVGLRRRKLHMTFGRVGAGVAMLVVATGVVIAVASARVTPPEVVIWGLTPDRFMAVPLVSVLIFAACVGVGVRYRRRPDLHRAAMFLGTLATISAAVSRIDPLNRLYDGTVWERLIGPFFVSLLIGGALVTLRCVLARRVERPLVLGYAGLVVASWAILAAARTEAWAWFAAMVTG